MKNMGKLIMHNVKQTAKDGGKITNRVDSDWEDFWNWLKCKLFGHKFELLTDDENEHGMCSRCGAILCKHT